MSATKSTDLARGLVLLLAIAVLAPACSSADDDSGADDSQGQGSALTCKAGEPHPCACLGQTAMGMQTCNMTGNGYSACTGCPALPASAGTGGKPTSTATGGAGGMDTTKPNTGGSGGMSGVIDAGMHDAALHEDSSVSLPAGAEPGVSCGVGLPTLCELETEKCCVRSLQTDSCIGADEQCDCPLDGCTVMEARCDGPEDCGNGEICCGTLANSGAGYQNFVCATTCMSNGNQRQACHGDTTPCPSGMICANSQLLTNVQVCIDPASIDQ